LELSLRKPDCELSAMTYLEKSLKSDENRFQAPSPAADAAARVAHLIKVLANAEAAGDPSAEIIRGRLATEQRRLAELEGRCFP